MSRRTQIVPVGVFLAAAARVRIPRASALDSDAGQRGGARHMVRVAVVDVVQTHLDADRAERAARTSAAAYIDPRLVKRARYESKLAKADAELAQIARELIAEIDADVATERAGLDSRLAEITSARLTDREVEYALGIAHDRTTGDSGWARAARELLSTGEVDISNMREVGLMTRASCKYA